jgi:hypothetical protein
MSICNNFRQEAGRVWNQMNEAQRLGMFLSEETITEMSLYNIAKRHHAKDVVIVPATKLQEAKHGADWEWWFIRNGKGIGFRVQAKRLFPNGRYQSLFKAKTRYAQLDKLVLEANTHGLMPRYCFYNFDTPEGGFSGHTSNCKHDYRGPSFWGCAIARPDDVKLLGKDSIGDLREILEPWHTLVCLRAGLDIPRSVARNFGTFSQRTANGDTDKASRKEPEVQEAPDYVVRLAAQARERRRSKGVASQYIDHVYWKEIAATKEDVVGILVVEQQADEHIDLSPI